jgi:hypothetical protein
MDSKPLFYDLTMDDLRLILKTNGFRLLMQVNYSIGFIRKRLQIVKTGQIYQKSSRLICLNILTLPILKLFGMVSQRMEQESF